MCLEGALQGPCYNPEQSYVVISCLAYASNLKQTMQHSPTLLSKSTEHSCADYHMTLTTIYMTIFVTSYSQSAFQEPSCRHKNTYAFLPLYFSSFLTCSFPSASPCGLAGETRVASLRCFANRAKTFPPSSFKMDRARLSSSSEDMTGLFEVVSYSSSPTTVSPSNPPWSVASLVRVVTAESASFWLNSGRVPEVETI